MAGIGFVLQKAYGPQMNADDADRTRALSCYVLRFFVDALH